MGAPEISDPLTPPGVRVTGTKIFSLFMRTAAAADIYPILSNPLPFPATCVSFSYAMATGFQLVEVAACQWGIIQSSDGVWSDEATRIDATDRRLAGAIPPDVAGDVTAFALPPTGSSFVGPFPVQIEVPAPGWRLFLRTSIQAAAFERVTLLVSVLTHTVGPNEGVIPIRPRGSKQEPFCLPVCIVDDKRPPEPPIVFPPPPGPEPPTPQPPDILAPPLPPPTDVEPIAPMRIASQICALVR